MLELEAKEKQEMLFCHLFEKTVQSEYHSGLGRDLGTLLIAQGDTTFQEPGQIGDTTFQEPGPIWSCFASKYPVIQNIIMKETVERFLKASNFDALAFCAFYSSLWYRSVREELHNEARPELLDEGLLWSRFSRRQDGLSFNLKRQARNHGLLGSDKDLSPSLIKAYNTIQKDMENVVLEEPQSVQLSLRATSSSGSFKIDDEKDREVTRLVKGIRDLYKAGSLSKAELLKGNDQRPGEQIWWQGNRPESWQKFSPVHKNTLKSACFVLASVLDSVFSHPERLRRLEGFHRQIPQSFLLTTLYFLNPAPFITKIIPLYTWKPTLTTPSLCQRFAYSIVGAGKTKNELEHILSKINNQDTRQKIKELSENCDLKSFSLDVDYVKALASHLQVDNPSQDEIDLLRHHLRMKEKMEYVEYLGSEGSSPFLDFCGQIFPPLLNELSKLGSLNKIVSEFFDALNKIIASLARNKSEPHNHDGIVAEITKILVGFVENFYPCLQKLAMRSGTRKELPVLTYFFDCLFGGLIGWSEQDGKKTDFHESILRYISSLSQEEQQSLWKDVETILYLSRRGVEEAEWPPVNPIITSKILPVFKKEYHKLFDILFNSSSQA